MRSSRRFLILAMGGLLVLLAGTALSRTVQAQSLPADRSRQPGPLRLLLDRHGPTLTIRPTYALSDTATADTTALRYELTVERTGASTSRSRQGGTFTPAPGRVDTLSTVRLTAQPGDRLHLHLVVRRHDQIVAEITRTEEISPSE